MKKTIPAVLLLAAYFATGRFGLQLDAVNHYASWVWAPSGLAVAGAFLLGRPAWVAIFLGALWVNRTTGAPWAVALGIAVGNTAEAIIASHGLRNIIQLNPSLKRLRDAIGFLTV